ncbi:MAG: ComF family protein [Candidatus Latescibacterota bacterium]|nr:MAG: ComF family protein [Candidatus Latescibacterota bacterium]
MRGFLSFLLDSLVPLSCVVCGRGIDGDADPPPAGGVPAAGSAFDPGCLYHELFAGIRMPARILCAACWRSLDRAAADAALSLGSGSPAPLISPFYTNDALLALVRFLKFAGGRSAAPPLAWWMADSLRRTLDRRGVRREAGAVLAPVPLHPRRLGERGYNQALLLARCVGRELGLQVEDGALVRERATKSQSKLGEDERAENVRGAFALRRPERIEGRGIVLVDDLVTTGGTARECLAALLGAAPAWTAVLSAGRVRDAGRAPGTRA